MQTENNAPVFEIFPWNSNFTVGIDFIDEQHKKLVELLNKVIAQFIIGNDHQANEAALTELIDYARFHFDEEEKLWRKHFGDAALANDHSKTHDIFFTKIQVILDEEAAGQSVTEKLIEYLTNWLAVHILHNDRRMATMVLEMEVNGTSLIEAERVAKDKINQMPILQSSIVELYKKLSKSASQLIREKNARLRAESQLQMIVKEKAEKALEMQAKEYQEHLEFLAYNDPLTGLLNGNGLLRELRRMMATANSEADSIAVISINLDYFGQIGSQLGSEGSNRLLGVLAKRWQDALMQNGALAHLGSDDFVVLLHNATLIEEQLSAMNLAAAQPFFIDEWRNSIAFTAGYSVYPSSYVDIELDAEKLQRQADYALFQAKHESRGTFRKFDFEAERNLRIKNDEILRIREGFDNDEFRLYYQPKINMRTGEIIGAEALIRWQHPDRGLLAPISFLPVLDNHPFIINLGEWVIDKAIQHILMWQQQDLVLTVSVNIDAIQVQDPLFPTKLSAILNRYPSFNPKCLDLEILETVAINDIDVAINNIYQCREYGVSFSLDDFGKGYCSLSYLKKLPVDTLKIDQTFVRNMLDDASNISILEGIIVIAKTFNLKVIAEGVESIMHGEFLIQIGCEFAQGYAIARPMEQALFINWLKQWKTYPQWSDTSALRRDDIVALTGLAELNQWIRQFDSESNNLQPLGFSHEFHSKSLEKWMRNSLEQRPSTDVFTVQKIENNYNNVLMLAKKVSENRESKKLTPNTGPLCDLNEALKALTEQIRVGLQECLLHRYKRQTGHRKQG